MLIIALIITFIWGLFILQILTPSLSKLEKTGLSFIVGIFATTVGMLFLDIINIPLTRVSILSLQILSLLLFAFFSFKDKQTNIGNIKSYFRDNFSVKEILNNYNSIWLVFIVFIVIIEIMNFSKCMYFATFDRDSLAGFVTIGYIKIGSAHV